MELMKILLEMELSSPSLVLPPDSFSWDDSSGLEVFEKTIKSREFLQDHPFLCFCTELTSEAPSSFIRPVVRAFVLQSQPGTIIANQFGSCLVKRTSFGRKVPQ